MNAEEVLITHAGYTDTAYATCGDYGCTTVVLRSLGAPETLAADYMRSMPISVGDDTTIDVALLGESDSCEWCAACGAFVRHGLAYEGEDVGCTHDQDGPDPADRPGPHIDLRDRPAMKAYQGTNTPDQRKACQ